MAGSKKQSSLARTAVLFLVSMVMVIGFWGHGEFYKLGQIPLVIIGGTGVFAVLKLISWANSSTTLGKRSAGTLLFDSGDVKLVQFGSKTAAIRPLRKTRMCAGSLYDAKLTIASDKTFSRLLVTDVYRKRLRDITDADAVRDGAKSLDDFRKRWEAAYRKWDDNEIVRVIEFRALSSLGGN